MRDHRSLRAFALANGLAVAVYSATRGFPREEAFGLTAQMRRAAVSVPANIVEGCARDTPNEYRNFLNIAFGSLRELGYYVDLSRQIGYVSAEEATALAGQHEECARVLSGLLKSVGPRRGI
jgi:four helix bundle protein